MKKLLMTVLVLFSLVFNAFSTDGSKATAKDAIPLLKEIRTGLTYPGLTVKEAAANLKTSKKIYIFVLAEIVLVNYRGAYASPDAVLRTRVANPTDRARLLAALLNEIGVETKLVRANWPQKMKPIQAAGRYRPIPAVKKLQDLLNIKAKKSVSNPPKLRQEISESSAVIETLLTNKQGFHFLRGTNDYDVEDTRTSVDWVWVLEKKADGKWYHVDPTFPFGVKKKYAPYAVKPVTLTLTLKSNNAKLLSWSGNIDKVLGYDMVMTVYPSGQKLEAAENPETIKKWQAHLQAGSVSVKGTPFDINATPAGKKITLDITVTNPHATSPWTKTYSRVLYNIGSGFDPHQMISQHRIGLSLGVVPQQVMQTSMIDEAIRAYHLSQLAKTGKSDPLLNKPAGMSSFSARTANSLLCGPLQFASEYMPIGWKGLTITIASSNLRKDKQLYCINRLDVLHSAFTPQEGVKKRDHLKWGLAIGAAEGQLMKTESVNQSLLKAKSDLKVIKSVDDAKGHSFGALADSVLKKSGVLIVSKSQPKSCWAISTSGYLYPVSATGSGFAKGAEARQVAAGRAYEALASGIASATGMPSGMLITALAGYFNELSKAYGGATSVLINLGRTIETGDDKYMLDNRSQYFRNIARHLTNAISRSAVRGWAESALGAGVNHKFFGPRSNASGPREHGVVTVGDRAIAGLVDADINLWPDFPVLPELLNKVMNLVTIPAEP